MPLTTNSARGRKSKKYGDAFEKAIAFALATAQQAGIVGTYVHNQPTYRKVGTRFIPVAAAGADFAGVFRGGLAFIIEAKSTTGARFYKGAISEKQILDLDRTVSAGALALLGLRFSSEDGRRRDFLVPWMRVLWRELRSAASIGPADLIGWGYQPHAPLARLIRVCGTCRRVWFDPVVVAMGAGPTGACLCGGEISQCG